MSWDAERYQSRHSYVFAYGEGLVEMLEPRAGERILDLGCGSGQLTAKIAESGAHTIGVDQSKEMIAEARRNFPALKFDVADAANFTLDAPVDAVFSNAALHWVKDADGVARSVASALRPGGRFVVELGGKGNVQTIIDELGPVETPWYFPSVGGYTSLLERHGFEITTLPCSIAPRASRVRMALRTGWGCSVVRCFRLQSFAAKSRSGCAQRCFATAGGCWITAGCE